MPISIPIPIPISISGSGSMALTLGRTPQGRIPDVDERLSDTTPEAGSLQIELLRQATPARRAGLALSLSATVLQLAHAGIRRRSPSISQVEAALQFVDIHYGAELARAVRHRLSAHTGT